MLILSDQKRIKSSRSSAFQWIQHPLNRLDLQAAFEIEYPCRHRSHWVLMETGRATMEHFENEAVVLVAGKDGRQSDSSTHVYLHLHLHLQSPCGQRPSISPYIDIGFRDGSARTTM